MHRDNVRPHGARSLGVCALVFLLAPGGCGDEPKVIDPFPINVDLSAGPVILMASEGSSDAILPFVVDVLTPITILDSFEPGGETANATRRLTELTLYGLQDDTVGPPRVRFPQTPTYSVHPCESDALCRVGLDGQTREIQGILGSDLLSRSSTRFNFQASTLRFFPDAAGTSAERTYGCEAVFGDAFGGGGTLIIDGSQVGFAGNRPTVGMCANHAPPDPLGLRSRETGSDFYMAISTALGPSIMTSNAYERFVAANDGTPLADLPTRTLYLSSGPVPVRLAEIPYIAITGTAGEDSDERGPCRELYANARLRSEDGCNAAAVDCPCPDNRTSCRAGAAVEVHRPIEVAVVDSSLPLLQALRDELRPRFPEIDGVLGVQALRDLRVEFDFPKGRLLMRCEELSTCITRPQVRTRTAARLEDLEECRSAEEKRRQMAAQPDGGVIEHSQLDAGI